jgi:D-lactate dehydrogenase
MKIAVFDTHRYDREALEQANHERGHELTFFEPRLVRATAALAAGFDAVCSFVNDELLAFDTRPDARLASELGVQYVGLEALYREADIVSLHVPLTPSTHHLINDSALASMKRGVMLINTGRGALIDSRALIAALKTGHIGGAGLDVYEEEEGIFFQDLSDRVLEDDVLARLLTFPNVLITAHQGFLTREALASIAETTLESAGAYERGDPLKNQVHPAEPRSRPART